MEFDENKSGRVVVKKQRGKQNLKTFITGELRRSSFRWRARTEAMQNARVERGKYKCNECKDLFGPKQIILDHIEPVVDPKVGWVDWNTFIERLFVPAEKFQILCHACSSVKTEIEDKMREHYKQKKEHIPDFTSDKRYTKKKKDEEN